MNTINIFTTLKKRYLLIILLLPLMAKEPAAAQDWKPVLDLRGEWKFEIGDNLKYAAPEFEDSKWDNIFVPAAWEDEGYSGYDGFAWYRKHFRLPRGTEKKDLFLLLGYVDDAAVIYLNGQIVGTMGSFPPDYWTAYKQEVILPLPAGILNISGDNVIAVRVYDDQLAGGITHGKVGLYEQKKNLNPEISFVGMWHFKTGDNDEWKEPSLEDSRWDKIFVPAYWEPQGYTNYNGVAWYRLHFTVPLELTEQRLVLFMGKIDDLDETYLNGEMIGNTGKIKSNSKRSDRRGEHKVLRVYTIPMRLLNKNSDNVIAVRVFDGGNPGGIYQGPVGIMTYSRFKEWKSKTSWKEYKPGENWNLIDIILGD